MNKIGICGTGKMGKEIGKRLLDCDQIVTAWNRTQNKVTPLVELGAIRANSITVSYTHLTLPTTR